MAANFIPFDYSKRSKQQIEKSYNKNFEAMYFIGPDAAHLYRLGAGITSVTPTNTDTTQQYSYLIDKGGSNSDQTQKAVSYAFVGNRNFGDPAQEFVKDLEDVMDASGYMVVVFPDGSQREGSINFNSIVADGGDMNARATFSFTAQFQGIPLSFSPEGYDMSVQGGTKTDVTQTGVIQNTYTRVDPNKPATSSTTTSSTPSQG